MGSSHRDLYCEENLELKRSSSSHSLNWSVSELRLDLCFLKNSLLRPVCLTKHTSAMSERTCRIKMGWWGRRSGVPTGLQGLWVEMWTIGGISLPIFDIAKPPRNKVKNSTFKLLQMPQAEGKFPYAVKYASKPSCYTQMFLRAGCGNHRAMYEPAAGVWKKRKYISVIPQLLCCQNINLKKAVKSTSSITLSLFVL